jgi:hypothetical protein
VLLGNVNNFYDKPSRTTRDTCIAHLLLALREDPKDYRASLITRKGCEIDGTCQWVLEHPKLRDWLSQQCGLLWISGNAGKGKTILALHLTSHLKVSEDAPEANGPIYFFCNSQSGKNTGTSILLGLLHQLLKRFPWAYEHLSNHYESYGAHLFEEGRFEPL